MRRLAEVLTSIAIGWAVLIAAFAVIVVVKSAFDYAQPWVEENGREIVIVAFLAVVGGVLTVFAYEVGHDLLTSWRRRGR